jgi:hypothetical protein
MGRSQAQPYRGGGGPRGATRRNMKRGRPAYGRNPQDTKRKLQKKSRRTRRRKTVSYYLKGVR